MPTPMPAPAVLDREYLEIRAKLLEVAASFDRIRRGAGEVASDPRMQQIQEALGVLQSDRDDLAEEIQLIFSLPYDDSWQKQLDISPRH